MSDKEVERQRYDRRAASQLTVTQESTSRGALSLVEYLRSPYLAFEREISRLIRPSDRILEIGAGTGIHTETLLRTGAQVVAMDVAGSALALLERDLGQSFPQLRTVVGDMEALPFEQGEFDVVVSAGALSYGDPKVVDAGIQRVLRLGGHFICVDSLSHNPIYRANRWVHFLRGNRTRSTLERMPTIHRIRSIASRFAQHDVEYFGAFTWAMPLIASVAGTARAAQWSDACDRAVHTRRMAFKFLLSARGRL